MLTYSSLRRSASFSAASVTLRRRGESETCVPPCARGDLLSSARNSAATSAGSAFSLRDDLGHDALALLDERQQQVLGQNLGMPLAVGELLCAEDRFLGFLGVLVDVHDRFDTHR